MDRRQFLLAGSALAATATLARPVVAQTAIPARIGYIPIIGTAPVFVAQGEGWLKDAGIAASFTVFESGPNMIQAFASGTIDFYLAGIAPLAVARSRGVDVRVVAATAIAENVFVAAPALAKFFTPGTAPAAAFKAHKAATGRAARLATQPAGSVPNTVLQYWLWEVAKADKGDVEVVPMGIDATQQAVLAGAVEGGIVREPALTIVQSRNPGIKLVAGGQELFPGQPGTVLAGSGAFVTKNPDTVQKLVDSLVRAAALIAKDPDRAAPHVAAALGKGIVDPALIRKALVSPASTFEIDPRKIIEPSRAMQTYQVKLGSLEKELPFEGLFETQFFERAVRTAG
ncbi:MAG: ABC transporter substrate-binding protein [Bosea sp. (in: a-proteobacteria)]|uniref:ABC transporter substrate-binding protein n=1 Tax=Bosea sp. (in: a-proteobacteria) TaxID=1871050 RepID=UPI0027339816|nr:ABC transporter substrate-binding protein [Bosea sp. (in: a-proteobacteria)]MDP3601487.1 ABC transporter substrate-binding protein [Bosea sp. (in: a-proteobacteria)]